MTDERWVEIADRLVMMVPCRHGWETKHCTRHAEGSCPYEYDRSNPEADCRCDEPLLIYGVTAIVAWLLANGVRGQDPRQVVSAAWSKELDAYSEAVDRMVAPAWFRPAHKFKTAAQGADRHLHACHVLRRVWDELRSPWVIR